MARLSSGMLTNPQELRSTSSSERARVGTYVEDETGRGFRYVQNGATAMVVGNLYQAPPEVTNHQSLTPSAAAVGDTEITVTLGATAVLENEYAGGHAVVIANTGEGNVFTIAGHPAADANGSLTLTLEEPLDAAIDANSDIDLVKNPYRHVILAETTENSSAVGVALHAIGSSEFGWLQTHGPGPVRASGALVVGNDGVRSTVTAGAVGPVTNLNADVQLNRLGHALTGVATSNYGVFYWTID